ncbi:phosphotransferase [Kineosporia succinea]|uniref:Aminoglycoside phosphotransferase domain-containing protein n=1 Tax=Kineosporia succinea TaxID=84632 RepID=A0ABT9P765_9ACTN|nr:phosphotransferase [Kineosporia succinea]MDP9828030.1 hypothetical protein [Kineosporia succinea]
MHTRTGSVFCKGTAIDNPQAWMHRREAVLNPHVPRDLAPRLRWQVAASGWLVTGFDRAPGRHVDIAPDSADLPLLTATLTAMSTTPAPGPPVKILTAGERWGGRISPELLAGDVLVHSDVTPKNFLVDDAHGRIAVVDWCTPVRGAAWIDTALMIVRLIRAGHTPAQAEAWAAQVPAWADATPTTVTLFARGTADRIAATNAQTPAVHLRELAAAADAWARHRAAEPAHV